MTTPNALVARQTETDISRVALRQEAVREVHLACLESREEMPADEVEIVEGEEEGIVRHNRLGPKEFLFREENGRKVVAGVRFRRVLSVFDANRRFAPVYDDAPDRGCGGRHRAALGGPDARSDVFWEMSPGCQVDPGDLRDRYAGSLRRRATWRTARA